VSLRFRILGPIEVDGARVPRSRPLSLLALLLVHRGTLVPADRAADELWDGAGPKHRRKAVHVVASRLRRTIGDDVLRSDGGGYALRLAPGDLDAEHFEALLARGREELVAGEAWEAAATLRQALALWRGPALTEVADERFAQPEIARLEELRLACLGDRIDADLACGRHEELVGELEALAQAHPLRERFRGHQMLALYRAGRQAEALEAYRGAYAALVDSRGIEPSPELRELEAAILRHEVPAPAHPPAAREPLAHDTRRLVTCVFAQLVEQADVDAESLRTALERFHATARTICEGRNGTVAEARTDAVLAVFGTHEDDALRAVRATAELVALPFGVRCGVGTGEVVAAAHGTVVGEAVAAAERLARAAARDGEARIDAHTWRAVRHAARATESGEGGFVLAAIDPDAPAIRRRLDRPLVGREPDLRRLREAFDRVVRERSAELMAVVGEPGIGKSRLVAELEAIAGDRGQVLTGRCPAYGEGITYWPLREVVEWAKGDRSVAELGATLAIPPSAVQQAAVAVGLEQGAVGEDTGWALLRVIEALARSRPLILAVDDVHLAEPALLALLRDVAAKLRGTPALIVWVARVDLFEQRHPHWRRHVGAERVLEVGPLPPAASAALIDAVAGGRLPARERERIADAAGGNPLFIEQLVAYVDERDASKGLPPALHALLSARLDRLAATERSALALGAVVGDAFEIDAVHALAAGITLAELEQARDRLIARDLLVDDEPVARFRHGLVREVAYASLTKSTRARLHERHAAWLDELGADLPEADARIGLHLETAHRYERELGGAAAERLASAAGRRLAAAGRIARMRGDLPGEIGFLDRAIALLGSGGEEGAQLLPALVSALIEAGASARAESLAQEAVSTSVALELPGVAARSAIERERVRLHRHPERFDVGAAVALVEQSARTLRARGDDLGLARADFLMADLIWLQGDLVASYAHAERMLAHARRAESGFDIATALIFMAWCLVDGPCPVPDAIARFDALETEVTGLRAAELTFRGCRAALTAMTGGYDDASGTMAEVRTGLAELRLSGVALYFALLASVAANHAGDAESAERAARAAEALVSDPGDRWIRSMIQTDLAHAILAQGRAGDAAAAVAEIDAVAAPCDADWVIKRHTARALLAALHGHPEPGLADARAAVAAAERASFVLSCASAHRTLAELLAATGRADAAADAARRALALYEAKGNLVAADAVKEQFAPGVTAP